MGRHIFWRFAVGLLCVAAICSADDTAFSSEQSETDWQMQRVAIHLTATVPVEIRDNPAAEFLLRQHLQPLLHEPLRKAIMPLKVDSRTTVAERSVQDPTLRDKMAALVRSATLLPTSLTEDLSEISLTLLLDMHPHLSSLFASHPKALPLRSEIAWRPSGDFTGLVIYAADELRLHGTDTRRYLEPAFLPEIYDADIRPVISYTEVDPQALHFWGMTGYSTTSEEDLQRVGLRPLRVAAVSIFGIYATDPVISNFDAGIILQSDTLREALRQGRIQIIISERRQEER